LVQFTSNLIKLGKLNNGKDSPYSIVPAGLSSPKILLSRGSLYHHMLVRRLLPDLVI
jgi:hypothetical protein